MIRNFVLRFPKYLTSLKILHCCYKTSYNRQNLKNYLGMRAYRRENIDSYYQ
ncbi:UNVERIFIED_CONTAM: hypothetical protein RMT77_004708 [Armadillidium vulgare]